MTATPRIAVVGARGQLGTDLLPLLDGAIALGHHDIEITDAASVSSCLDRVQAQIVINCAAYNLVDAAEDSPEIAYEVNAIGPRNLAAYCGDRDIALLHVSTDYVFGLDRDRIQPLAESNAPGPVSAYGISKLAGEYFVRGLCARHFIVRTCGLYGNVGTSGKGNFVKTMLRLGTERDQLTVVSDQHCTPSFTADVALAIARLVQTESYGLYHATNSGATTWFDLAAEVFRLAGTRVDLQPISTEQFGAKAARPRFSVLDCSKLADTTGYAMPDWRDAVARYVNQL